MRNFIWLVALPCMVTELYAKWLWFPVSKQLRGYQFSLSGYSTLRHGFPIDSYGLIAAILIALGAFFFVLGKNRLIALVGAALVWLAVLAVGQVAWTDPPLLRTLAAEFGQQQSAAAFTQAALPVNAGNEPSVWPRIPFDTVGDRLIAGCYFARFGVTLALLAGLLALGYAMSRAESSSMAWLTLGGVALLLVLTAARPACAEWEIAHAAVAETRGATDEAIARYRHALTLDGWPALNLDLYERIGAIDGNFGRIKTVEYGIYHAELSITQIDPTKAVSELAALLPRTTEPLTGLLHRRIAEILAQQARALHAYAAYGAAAAKCKEALSHDPDALLPAYYLSRELYLIGAYREASAFTEQTLKRVDDPVLRANLFANLGDAQTELGAYDAAKVAYRNSYQYDYLLNLRSLSALNGP